MEILALFPDSYELAVKHEFTFVAKALQPQDCDGPDILVGGQSTFHFNEIPKLGPGETFSIRLACKVCIVRSISELACHPWPFNDETRASYLVSCSFIRVVPFGSKVEQHWAKERAISAYSECTSVHPIMVIFGPRSNANSKFVSSHPFRHHNWRCSSDGNHPMLVFSELTLIP